jgi:hypothetical protein
MRKVPTIMLALIALVVGGLAQADEVAVTLERGITTITIVGDGDAQNARGLVSGDANRVLALEARRSIDPSHADGLLRGGEALDVARRSNLEGGISPWRAHLDYDGSLGRAVWRVFTTTAAKGGDAEGAVLTLDARTGDVLAREVWSVSVELAR